MALPLIPVLVVAAKNVALRAGVSLATRGAQAAAATRAAQAAAAARAAQILAQARAAADVAAKAGKQAWDAAIKAGKTLKQAAEARAAAIAAQARTTAEAAVQAGKQTYDAAIKSGETVAKAAQLRAAAILVTLSPFLYRLQQLGWNNVYDLVSEAVRLGAVTADAILTAIRNATNTVQDEDKEDEEGDIGENDEGDAGNNDGDPGDKGGDGDKDDDGGTGDDDEGDDDEDDDEDDDDEGDDDEEDDEGDDDGDDDDEGDEDDEGDDDDEEGDDDDDQPNLPPPPPPPEIPATQPASPILLDLSGLLNTDTGGQGTGIETTCMTTNGVMFDLTGSGFKTATGWFSGFSAALCLDKNFNGIIDNGTELFGNFTLMPDGSRAINGFIGISQYDSDKNGVIDANDEIWQHLRVWRDVNGNAETDEGELFTLDELGIVSLNLSYVNSNFRDEYGNEFRQIGSFTDSQGNTHQMADVWFRTNPTISRPVDTVEIPPDIALLPNAKGFGVVRDLHEAMALDETGRLKALVEQFVAEADREARNALIPQIMFLWAGEKVSNLSFGNVITAEQLGTLEAFWGWRNFTGLNGSNHANQLAECYQQLEDMVFYQLMSQSHLKELYELIPFTYDEDLQAWRGDYLR